MTRLRLLAGVLVLPPLVALLALHAPAASFASLALAVAGLAALRWAAAGPGLDAALCLAFYATFLFRDVLAGAGPGAALRFALAAALVARWQRAGRERSWLAALLIPGLVALSLEVPLEWPREALLDTLFASRGGLLFWNPVLWLGLAGLLLPPHRSALLPGLGLVAVLAVRGPHAAAAVLPLLILGLARALRVVERLAARRPGIVMAAGGFLLVTWNALLMAQYRSGRVPADDTVSFARVAENSATLLSESVGTPLAWPANWVFAARDRVSPAEYDRRAGSRLFSGPTQRTTLIEAGDARSDPVFFSTGWTSPRPCEDALCLGVLGRGRLFLPLDAAEPLTLVLRLRGEGQALLAVNGVGIGGIVLGERLDERRLRVSAERLRPGFNELTLEAPAGSLVWLDWIACERDAP